MHDSRDPDPYVIATHGPDTRVLDTQPAHMRYEDLVRYFRENYPAEIADEHIAHLTPEPHPGERWSPDIVVAIARYSPEHAERGRIHLGWSVEQMAEALRRRPTK